VCVCVCMFGQLLASDAVLLWGEVFVNSHTNNEMCRLLVVD